MVEDTRYTKKQDTFLRNLESLTLELFIHKNCLNKICAYLFCGNINFKFPYRYNDEFLPHFNIL